MDSPFDEVSYLEIMSSETGQQYVGLFSNTTNTLYIMTIAVDKTIGTTVTPLFENVSTVTLDSSVKSNRRAGSGRPLMVISSLDVSKISLKLLMTKSMVVVQAAMTNVITVLGVYREKGYANIGTILACTVVSTLSCGTTA